MNVALTEPRDLFSSEFRSNPYPTFAWLRRTAPVYWADSYSHFVITRYDDCVYVLSHPEQFTSFPESDRNLEPAKHVHYRNIVARAFDAEFVARLEPPVQAIVDRLIDGIAGDGEADLVPAFAKPLPTLVLAEMLGIPGSDLSMFMAWASTYSRAMNERLDDEGVDLYRQTARDLVGYFAFLTELRRRNPANDLISRLTGAELDGAVLSPRDILALCEQLMVAGRDLTTGLICNCLAALFAFPLQLQRLREQPGLLDAAIEESLRWDSPVLSQPRKNRFETELRGVSIPAGANLLVAFAAANRDPDIFTSPDEFDIQRPNASRHLAFGRGIHFCLGAPLARVEARLALRTLLERLPGLQPARHQQPIRGQAEAMLNLRSFQSLPVEFSH